MFTYLKDYSNLQPYNYYTPASDREAYEEIPVAFKNTIIKEGEKYLNYSFPSIPATTYMTFLRTGNRVAFEDVNFSKRYAINALIMAECMEYKGRFLDDIINGIFSICEESAWQLPPHNSYPGLPNQLLPDVTRPVIDLFACETAALLATAGYLLKDAFDSVHPFIYERIVHEITNRVLIPFIETNVWWMGQNNKKTCNWTIWCTQNVLIAAFLADLERNPQAAHSDQQSQELHAINTAEFKESIFRKACDCVSAFVRDYGEDGCCDEGAQYYRHAGLCLFNTMELLNNITNGKVTPLYGNEKIKNIALYIMNVHVDDKYYINFADCSPVAGRAGVREFLFGKCIESSAMQSFAAKEYKVNEDKLLSKEINLFYHIQNAFAYKEILTYPESKTEYRDLYYESVGLFISRDDTLYLAAKAGHNADSHNHNDTGSFTVYKNGKPFIIDVGVETYTKKTFSADRYELWAMQSAYHNLPTINGVMQKDGREYAACDVQYSFSDELAAISMDIAKAYPAEAGICSYKRCLTLNKGSNITIEDSIIYTDETAENNCVLSIMTYEAPAVESNTISVGTLGKIVINSNYCDVSYEEIPIEDARLKTAWEHSIYRILITTHEPSIKLSIE